MIAETKQIFILRKGFSELGVLLNQNGLELRVSQFFSQSCGLVRETTELILMENRQIVSLTGFIAQIMVQIPDRLVAPKTLAMLWATEGFSANTNFICIYSFPKK